MATLLVGHYLAGMVSRKPDATLLLFRHDLPYPTDAGGSKE